jgi:small conductance mechanosensitive channel
LARLVVKWLVSRSRTDDFLGDLIGRILSYVIVTFGLAYALDVFGIAIAPILGALGIAGIALAFALQDILENFVAGVILQARRPFSDQEGSVVSIDACTITLHTPDGETVKVPSALVIKNSIVNHTQIGRRRTTVDVGVA